LDTLVTTPSNSRLFLTEAETAGLLGISAATLNRLARAGKSPIEPVVISPRARRYRRIDIDRLAGVIPGART